jgi:hypothetical protein
VSNINYAGLKVYDRTITKADFNKLVDIVQSITLNSGVNYRIKRTTGGTTLVASGSNAGITACPFDVTTAPATGGSGNMVATVRAGTINNLLPSNIFSSFPFNSSQVIQVKAHVLTDGQAVTSSTLVVDDTPPAVQEPTPFALPTTVDVLLSVIFNGVVYRVVACGSIQLTGVQQFITNPSTPASPGTLNYIPYYIWQAGVV